MYRSTSPTPKKYHAQRLHKGALSHEFCGVLMSRASDDPSAFITKSGRFPPPSRYWKSLGHLPSHRYNAFGVPIKATKAFHSTPFAMVSLNSTVPRMASRLSFVEPMRIALKSIATVDG